MENARDAQKAARQTADAVLAREEDQQRALIQARLECKDMEEKVGWRRLRASYWTASTCNQHKVMAVLILLSCHDGTVPSFTIWCPWGKPDHKMRWVLPYSGCKHSSLGLLGLH